jgi:hypothetical protein
MIEKAILVFLLQIYNKEKIYIYQNLYNYYLSDINLILEYLAVLKLPSSRGSTLPLLL